MNRGIPDSRPRLTPDGVTGGGRTRLQRDLLQPSGMLTIATFKEEDKTEVKPMRTEKEKMLAGELYDPLAPELVRARDRARELCQELNATRERDQEARRSILIQLFGQGGES